MTFERLRRPNGAPALGDERLLLKFPRSTFLFIWLFLGSLPCRADDVAIRREPLVLSEGGTPGQPFVFDGRAMIIDLGIDVTENEWSVEGDLVRSLGPVEDRVPIAAGQLAGLFIDEMPLSLPRDVAAEKLNPERKQFCYVAIEELDPGEMGYEEDGSVYFRMPLAKTFGQCKIILPPMPGTSCVSIQASYVTVRNLTAKYAANDGFNFHGSSQGIRLENVRAFSNADEGISAHGTCEVTVVDSEVAFNGSAAGGVADVGDSVTSYKRCHVHDNLGVAFYLNGRHHRVFNCRTENNRKPIVVVGEAIVETDLERDSKP